jgi:hypothetical protein
MDFAVLDFDGVPGDQAPKGAMRYAVRGTWCGGGAMVAQ